MLDLFYKADLTSLITRGYRFEACAKCGMEPSKHVSFKNIQEFICQMDINIDNMTGLYLINLLCNININYKCVYLQAGLRR